MSIADHLVITEDPDLQALANTKSAQGLLDHCIVSYNIQGDPEDDDVHFNRGVDNGLLLAGAWLDRQHEDADVHIYHIDVTDEEGCMYHTAYFVGTKEELTAKFEALPPK